MATLKNNWLIVSITAIILFSGAFIVVKAMGNNVEKQQIEQTKKTLVTRWFAITSYDTGDPTDKDNQILGTELSTPPSSLPNPTPCSTGNSAGGPCAVELELDGDIEEDELEGMSVSQVESAHQTTAGTYAKKQLQP